jgi:hypothetical protein
MNALVVADRASDWRRLKGLVLDSVSSHEEPGRNQMLKEANQSHRTRRREQQNAYLDISLVRRLSKISR